MSRVGAWMLTQYTQVSNSVICMIQWDFSVVSLHPTTSVDFRRLSPFSSSFIPTNANRFFSSWIPQLPRKWFSLQRNSDSTHRTSRTGLPFSFLLKPFKLGQTRVNRRIWVRGLSLIMNSGGNGKLRRKFNQNSTVKWGWRWGLRGKEYKLETCKEKRFSVGTQPTSGCIPKLPHGDGIFFAQTLDRPASLARVGRKEGISLEFWRNLIVSSYLADNRRRRSRVGRELVEYYNCFEGNYKDTVD